MFWRTVYRIDDDVALLEGLRQRTSAYYVYPHGPIASPSWWAALRLGKVSQRAVEGVVSKYWPHGDEPGQSARFELTSDDGSRSEWVNWGEQGYRRLYELGRRVRVNYACLDLAAGSRAKKELPLRIWMRVR
jgi:hypothetical protein